MNPSTTAQPVFVARSLTKTYRMGEMSATGFG